MLNKIIRLPVADFFTSAFPQEMATPLQALSISRSHAIRTSIFLGQIRLSNGIELGAEVLCQRKVKHRGLFNFVTPLSLLQTHRRPTSVQVLPLHEYQGLVIQDQHPTNKAGTFKPVWFRRIGAASIS